MSARLKLGALAMFATLLSFTGASMAAGVASPEDGSLLDYAKPLFDAVMHGQYWAGASLAVVFLCALARKYMPDPWKHGLRGDITGAATAFGISAFGALATGLLALGTNSLTLGLALTALKVGFFAIGGYTVLHKAAQALTATKWWSTKAPGWLKLLVAFALRLFGSDAASAQKEAEAAGDAAVRDNPAPATNPTLGEPTDV